MSGDLGELYRQVVLDHSRHPRNFRRIDNAGAHAEGANPLCGDRVTVYLRLDGERIAEAAFEATGCAISLASASMMTEILGGASLATARELCHVAETVFRGECGPERAPGDLAALGGVRAYPSRIRCALLPWRTLRAALDGAPGSVSTEED